MPQVGQPPRQQTAARDEESAVDLIDPVSFEAKLLEARARREAVARWRAPPQPAPPDRPLPGGERSGETPGPEPALIRLSPDRPTAEPVRPAEPPTPRKRLSGGIALLLGFAFGAVLAGGVLAVAPSLWEWVSRLEQAPSATTAQPNDPVPETAQAPSANDRPPGVPAEAARPDNSPPELTAAQVAQRLAQLPAVPPDIAAADPLPVLRPPADPAPASPAGQTALPRAALSATQPRALPTIAAIPSLTLRADGPELPVDISPATVTPRTAAATPAETFAQRPVALPPIDPVAAAFAPIEAFAPPAIAAPAPVSAPPAPMLSAVIPAAISAEVVRLRAGPALSLGPAISQSPWQMAVASLAGDFPLPDADAPAPQATAPAAPARAAPVSTPRATEAAPARSARVPEATPPDPQAGAAGQAKRALMESTVEDMLRERFNRR